MSRTTVSVVCLLTALAGASAEGEQRPGKHAGADLPPLLEFLDGAPVRSVEDWARRKEEIRRLTCETFVGTYPEKRPAILKAEVLERRHPDDGSLRRRVKLTFDSRNKISLEMCVWIPKGEGPFPILLTAPRHYQIGWANEALSRGYLVCLYPGVDSHHREKDYPGYDRVWETFRAEYPGATWTEISIKAWLASRCLDCLLDPQYGYNVAPGQVGIIGHSRYGKQALIAAAFDQRITAVVARSPGSPGSCAYRFCSRTTFAEAPADFPGEWFLSSLRTYTGRENELPIDAHGWLALIAPRRCLIHTAQNDDCEPTFAVERSYLEARKVYRLLGRPENLRVHYRSGGHDPITDEHRRQNLDWFDLSFSRDTRKVSEFPETLLHQFDWQAWRAQQADGDVEPPPPLGADMDRRRIVERIEWALGKEPDSIAWDGKRTFLTPEESALMTHDRWQVPGVARLPVSFGANVRGNVYYNPGVKKPAPAVIWLHPYSYASGYNEGYGVEGTTVYHRLAQQGYVVLAYDQCGFGLRLLEGRDFYKHYPRWSRLGRMIHDVRAAVDFLRDGKGAAQGEMPAVDRNRICLLGYSLGGTAGLYAAALDRRIAGVASFCGFTPLRTDTSDRPTGGNRRLYQWHALQPKLGLFQEREERIPYDFEHVLSLIAPRPCLIHAPKRDRHATFQEVDACVGRAKTAWARKGQPGGLTLLTPDDTSRFQSAQQQVFLQWFAGVPARGTTSRSP